MTGPDGGGRPASSPAGPPTVRLHIGTMKTGTSYLQQVLSRNVALLVEQGVCYPATSIPIGRATRGALHDADSGDTDSGDTDSGDTDLDDVEDGDVGDGNAGAESGGAADQRAWAALVEHVHSWPGPAAVVSSELLSFATRDQARQIVESLRPARVEIVITARDLARLLPSAWQNKVKHGRSWSFATYVASVTSDTRRTGGPARSFWHHHDLVEIVQRWVAAVGVDQVTVVTVPPSGGPPSLLWERFAAAIDVDPAGFDTAQDQKSNLSLGYTEAELLRKVNHALRDEIDKETHRLHVQAYFANVVLRPAGEPTEPTDHAETGQSETGRAKPDRAPPDRPLVPSAAYDWTIEKSLEMVKELREIGVRVVGDLQELVPPELTPEQRAASDAAVPPSIPEPVVRAVVRLLLERIAAGTKRGRRGPAQRGRAQTGEARRGEARGEGRRSELRRGEARRGEARRGR